MVTIERLKRGYMAAREAGDREKMAKYASAIRSFQKSQESEDFSAYKMVSNIPKSGFEYGKGIVNAVTSPIDTAEGVWNVASGAVQKAIPGEQGNEKYADAVGEFFKERYGSLDAAKKTLQDDPVGVLGDLSVVLGGSGAALKHAPKMGQAGKAIQDVGVAIEPVNAVVGAASLPVRAVTPKTAPAEMYESAVKFSPAKFTTAERMKMAQTAVDKKIMPTRGGLVKAQEMLGGLDEKINTLITQANDTKKAVPVDSVLRHLKGVRQELAGVNLEGGKNLKIIDGVAKKFIKHMEDNVKKDTMTAGELQKLKSNIYKDVNYNKKRAKGTRAKEAASKAIARAAKEDIESLAPGIKEVNREWGDIAQLLDNLEQPASRIGNRDIMSIGMPIKAGAGASVGGSLGGLLGMPGMGAAAGSAFGIGAGMLDIPTFKSGLAISLNQLKKHGVQQNLSPAMIRGLLAQAGRDDLQGLLR